MSPQAKRSPTRRDVKEALIIRWASMTNVRGAFQENKIQTESEGIRKKVDSCRVK